MVSRNMHYMLNYLNILVQSHYVRTLALAIENLQFDIGRLGLHT